jgi:PAS domain S-box-containing protein/putative nucleotidyltransferase with HDIG domain
MNKRKNKSINNKKKLVNEEESQIFKKYFESYLEYAGVLFLVLDKEGHVSLINKKGVELLGYPEEDIIGKDWFINFLPEEIRSETKEYFMKIIRGEVPIESYYENPVITKSSVKTLQWQNTLLKDASGKVFGILASAEDITERKQVEEALRKSEEKFKILIETTNTGFHILDAQGRVIDANKEYIRFTGYDTLEEILGRSVAEWTAPHDRERNATEVKKCIEQGYVRNLEIDYVNQIGQITPIEINASVIGSGDSAKIFSLCRNITERKQMEEALKNINKQLEKMYNFQSITRKINQILLRANNENEIYKTVCDIFMEADLIKFVWIGLIEEGNFDVKTVACAGIKKEYINSIQAKWDNSPHGNGPTGIAIKTQKPVVIGNIRTDTRYMPWRKEALKKDFLSIISLPIIHEGKVMGVLDVYSDKKEAFNKESVEFLKELTTDIAIGIKSIRLEKKIKEKDKQLEKSIENIIFTMAKMSEFKDPYTAGHQKRVSQLTTAIARKMGLTEDKIESIKFASLIHDIGKFTIPGEILSKPAKLSETEFALIKEHPKTCYNIIKDVDFPWEIASIILQHHERLDGSGYPEGLKDKEILLESKILAVADVVEAMSSHRPYRVALGIDKALEEISMNKGKLYDPEAVDACIKLFKEDGFKFK